MEVLGVAGLASLEPTRPSSPSANETPSTSLSKVSTRSRSGALHSGGVRRAIYRQTLGLATAARNCDHIATKPRDTGRDGCPIRVGGMAVDQDQRGREVIRRTGGDG